MAQTYLVPISVDHAAALSATLATQILRLAWTFNDESAANQQVHLEEIQRLASQITFSSEWIQRERGHHPVDGLSMTEIAALDRLRDLRGADLG